MDRPPILTARQRDLLPYLISGCTRAEISTALNISEETVRKHVRNVLELFEAVNIRDAMIDMVQYHSMYGTDGPHYHYYVDRNDMLLTHLEDGEKSILELDQDFYVVAGELTELLDRMQVVGTVLSHTCNGEEQVPFESLLGLDKFRYVLPEPVKSGGTFRRQKRYVFKNEFVKARRWNIGTRAPWRDLNFAIKFAPNRPATHGWVKQELNNVPLDDLTPALSDDGLEYFINIPAPKIGTETYFHWGWDDE